VPGRRSSNALAVRHVVAGSGDDDDDVMSGLRVVSHAGADIGMLCRRDETTTNLLNGCMTFSGRLVGPLSYIRLLTCENLRPRM